MDTFSAIAGDFLLWQRGLWPAASYLCDGKGLIVKAFEYVLNDVQVITPGSFPGPALLCRPRG